MLEAESRAGLSNRMTDQAYPHLSKAPIFEATIELRVSSVPPPEAAYESFRQRVIDSYPSHSKLNFIAPRVIVDVQQEREVETRVSTGVIGVRLESADKKSVVHAKRDGLVVSRLAPYTSWVDLIAATRSLWALYVELFHPKVVTRLGARYINHIALPSDPSVDLDEIFTAGPKIPPALPQELQEYGIRTVINIPAHHAVVAIVQGIGLPPPFGAGPNVATLDIDAYSSEVPIKPDSLEVWERLEHLHSVKNLAFFESLHKDFWRRYI